MKSIVPNLCYYCEGTISNGFSFVPFPLHSILANMEPYLVSNLKLMVNSVLIMSSFIPSLTLLQLLLYCMMNHLYSLNKLLCFVAFILSIAIPFFPKDHISFNSFLRTISPLPNILWINPWPYILWSNITGYHEEGLSTEYPFSGPM